METFRRCAPVFVLTVALGVSLASPALGDSVGTDAKDAPADAACIAAAQARTTGAWVCTGNELSYEATDADGATTWESETFDGSAPPGDDVPAAAWDDDYSCEPTGVCNALIDAYGARVKANSYYGVCDSNGDCETWGSFDQVWRQRFDGKWPRWKLHLVWDYGCAVDTLWWRAQVRKSIDWWPDPILGYAYFYPSTISSQDWHHYSPAGGKAYRYADEAINESGQFYDDLYGYFNACGRRFGTSKLHTGHWKSTWNSISKYYEQKYTSTWY